MWSLAMNEEKKENGEENETILECLFRKKWNIKGQVLIPVAFISWQGLIDVDVTPHEGMRF